MQGCEIRDAGIALRSCVLDFGRVAKDGMRDDGYWMLALCQITDLPITDHQLLGFRGFALRPRVAEALAEAQAVRWSLGR